MGTYTKNLKLETPNYTDNADIPTLVKKNNEILDNEIIKRANGVDYNEQTGVLQLTGNNSKVGSPIQIKNNLPVTSMASGTELKLNNNKEVIKLSVDGKTSQKSYTGKNSLNLPNGTNTSNGITTTIKNNKVTITGTTKQNWFTIATDLNVSLSAGKYTLFKENTSIRYNIIYLDSSGNKKTTYDNNETTKILTFNEDVTIVTVMSDNNEVDKTLNISSYIMLCKGTDTADTSFEPYCGGQSSPNPDYPQEIENIRGVENLLKLPDGTYESNDITAVIKDGVITLNGTATANSFINVPFNYNFIANKEYTLSAHNSQTVAGECYIRLQKNNTVYFPVRLNSVNSEYSINFSENLTVETFNIRTEKGKTYNNFVIKPQLEEGPIAHDYVLYGSNYLQLKNTTDNESKIINIDLKGNELCSNKEQTLKDELIIENDRAKIIKKYDEVILDGTEDIGYYGKYGSHQLFYYDFLGDSNYKNNNKVIALCNQYKCVSDTNNAINAMKNFEMRVREKDGRLYWQDDRYNNTSDMKSWLSNNNMVICYELAEPKVIDLGEVDLNLLENSTLTCDEEPNMQIDYLTIDSNVFIQDSLDGNSSQKAPSIHAIKEYFNKKVYDKDSNGWTKIEFFDHTEYVAEGQILQIDFATGWGNAKLLSLPVGMESVGERILTGNVRTHDAAISVNISGILTETQITYNWKNNFSSNVKSGLNYSLRLLEYK